MRSGDAGSLRIAICDDRDADRAALGRALETYLAARGRTARVVSCSDSAALLAANAVEPFDVFLLDVVLSETNGIELAQRLQAAGSTAAVIFASTSPEYAADSFGAGVSYLIKPYTDVQFGAAFDRALAALAQRRNTSVVFKSAEGIRRVRTNDIRRAETRGHHQEVLLASGDSLLVRMSHGELMERLTSFDAFVEVGLSSIVNLDYVLEIANGRAVLDDGTEVAIPRRIFARVYDAFFRHYCS